jgi:cardiolipin synthase
VWKLAAPLILALLTAGCPYPNHPDDLQVRDPVPSGGDGFSLALYQSVGVSMRPGHQVELVENGRIFDVLEEEILRAESSIHIVSFIWRPSYPSTRLIRAILKRTHEGVACRILYEPFGSPGFDDKIRRTLAEGGCDVRRFRNYSNGTPGRLFYRNHRKILIVDGKRGVTGGFGIWWSWLGDGLSPDEWRESNVRVRGPAVAEMQLAFSENWQEAGGALLGPDAFPKLEEAGPARAAFVASTAAAGETSAERLTQIAIASAQYRLWIANSYFIPSKAIADALVRKAQAGVDVRILAPGRNHDLHPIRSAQRSTYAQLLSKGVRIWEYQPAMMHSKTMLIDDRLVVVGSINIDPMSMRKSEEGALVIEDPALAAELERYWQVDLERSMEIRWDSWRRRGLLERLMYELTWIFGAFA